MDFFVGGPAAETRQQGTKMSFRRIEERLGKGLLAAVFRLELIGRRRESTSLGNSFELALSERANRFVVREGRYSHRIEH